MAKEKDNRDSTSLPNLLVSRTEAEQKIRNQIEKGCKIRDSKIGSEQDLKEARSERSRWSDYNRDLLARLFDDTSISEQYKRSTSISFFAVSDTTMAEEIEDFRERMGRHIAALESVLNRLELVPEAREEFTLGREGRFGKDIFIVHGHDEAAKQSVARFIERLDLRAVILHEQPNAGRTIIEKFEEYSNVGFAIVLLTPDDIGYPKDKPDEEKPRSRQNVIFELGFFVGKLGRERVCALYKEGIEVPSDFQGVLYIEMDTRGGWQIELAKEIKHVGIEVDMNKVV